MVSDLEFKKSVFKWQTLRLMAAKYAYYIRAEPYLKDIGYDMAEKEWFKMGRELGLLKEDETSPCIDFDEKHELAKDAKLLGNYLIKPTYSCIYQIILHKYKQFPEYWV